MTVLNTLYVSGGRQAIVVTLEIRNGDDRLLLAKSFVPVTVALETGEVVTFEAAAMDAALPARNSDGTQDLIFTVSNVEGRASSIIRRSIASGVQTTVTYREYLSDDITGPAKRPVTMPIKDGAWSPLQADIRAGFVNLLDTAWPRDLFNPRDYPGLRFLA